MVIQEKDYILVMPDNKIIPVDDIEYAKALVNTYYEKKLEISKSKPEFEELDFTDEESREEVFRTIGVIESEPKLYRTEDIIESVREMNLFDDEQEEIITDLLLARLEINKYFLEELLISLDPIQLCT